MCRIPIANYDCTQCLSKRNFTYFVHVQRAYCLRIAHVMLSFNFTIYKQRYSKYMSWMCHTDVNESHAIFFVHSFLFLILVAKNKYCFGWSTPKPEFKYGRTMKTQNKICGVKKKIATLLAFCFRHSTGTTMDHVRSRQRNSHKNYK